MKNEINAVLENMTATTPEPEDYTGEDGLLYCGKCRKPKEAYFAPNKAAIFGRGLSQCSGSPANTLSVRLAYWETSVLSERW